LNKFEEKNRFFQGDILWLGFGTKFLPYHRQKRTIGKSQWTISKKVKYFIDGVLNTSYVPIRMMSLLGMTTSLIGFIYALLITYGRLFLKSSPFQGWAPIMVLILIIGGLIMLMLGIIGEYIWRIYDEVRKRPNYIVKFKYF
jgi:polyisoprenyl-phosphate glycosyltransferase